MALKKQITKAEYDALASAFQAEYKASGENFVLDIEGDDGIDWKKKREIEAEHRRNAERERDTAREEADNLRRGAIPKNDVEALENSWKTKVETTKTELQAQIAERDITINNLTVDTVAKDVASIFLAPALAVPMIRSRLKSEISNGVATTRVLDKNGQLSAMSVDDLKNEFKADAAYAPVLVGGKGSGAGGGKEDGKGAGGEKKLKDMNDAERAEWVKRDPDGFRKAVAADKLS